MSVLSDDDDLIIHNITQCSLTVKEPDACRRRMILRDTDDPVSDTSSDSDDPIDDPYAFFDVY